MFLCLSVLVHKYVVGVCARIYMIQLVRPLGVTNSECPQLPICFFEKTVLVILLQLILFFFFCDCYLSLYNWDWGHERECPVTLGQEVEVDHYERSCSAQTCYIWHSVFIGVRPRFVHCFYPQPFSRSLSPLANFPPRPSPSSNPLLPSSVCFCSLNSLPVLMSTPSLSNYPYSLCCAWLTVKKRLHGKV